MKNLLFSFFLLFAFFTATNVFAVDITAGDILLNISPTNPRPFAQVTVNLESYSVDLNKANIEWINNGKPVLSGIGKTKYSFTAGGPNTSTNFDITIVPEDATFSIKKSFTIRPSDIDLLWEATDSYTPPFYKGKALPGAQAQIKVVAYPNTSGISNASQKNITYTWKNNYNTIKSASGTGKNKYTFTNDSLKNSEKINVTASGPNGSYNGEGTVSIDIINPQIIFYKKSPLEGILYNNAIIENTYLSEDEITFIGEPYYLSFKEGSSGFNYTWKINGDIIDTPRNPRELTVRPSSRGGYATVGFSMENLTKLFQTVTNSLRIEL